MKQRRWSVLGLPRWAGCYPCRRRSRPPTVRCPRKMRHLRNQCLSLRYQRLRSQRPPAALTSPEVVQQLEPIARDLAALRRSLEQIAAKQEQMVQNIATLQAAEQDLRQTLASPPPSRTVPLPPRRPPQLAAQSSAVQSLSVPPPPPSTQLPLPLR